MATLRQRKIAWLEYSGLTNQEAQTFADQYTQSQLRQLPYFKNLLRNRRLRRAAALKAGVSKTEYNRGIRNWYVRNKLLTDDGKMDIWTMLRRYRKEAIISGDYTPPKKKGSHHKGGISKGDVEGQKKRYQQKSAYERGLEKQGKI